MAAHSPTQPVAASVMPYQPPSGWDAWLREIAAAINQTSAWAENAVLEGVPGPPGATGAPGPAGPAGPPGTAVTDVVYPASFGLTNNNVANDPADFAAMMAHMVSIASTGGTVLYPAITAQPLIFPGGSYKMASFTPLTLWGAGATLGGYGYCTVLDNIGIEWGTLRWVHVDKMILGKRDTVVVPGSYGIWTHGQPRLGNINNIIVLHRDFGFIGGATLLQTAEFPANATVENVTANFCRIGLYCAGAVAYNFVNCAFGAGTGAEYAALLYGTQGVKALGGFWNMGSEASMKIVGNRRHASVENYFLGTTFTGTSVHDDYPILAVTNDGGFARLTLGTKIGARVEAHAPIMQWDPFFKNKSGPAASDLIEGVATCLCVTDGVTGQIDQIAIGGTNLLSAPVVALASETLTNNALAVAVNAGTGTHGYSVFVKGAYFYLDAYANPAAVGRVIAITTSGGLVITPDEVAAVVFDAPHGFVLRSDIHFAVLKVLADVTIVGTDMTVNTITSGGDNIKIGQLVYGAGISETENITILSQTSGTTGGVGVYVLSAAHPGTGLDVTIGFTEYDGQMTVDYVEDANTIITRLDYSVGAVGQAWKQLFFGAGLPQVVIDGTPDFVNVRITAVDDTSLLLEIPYADIGTPLVIGKPRFDLDIESLDLNNTGVNDQFFGWGNCNWLRIRSAYNLFFVGPRPAKIFLWIDKRSHARMKPNRIFFIRPGRGRSFDVDSDADFDSIQVHGTNEGFGLIEMSSGGSGQPGDETLQMAVGQYGAPLANNAAPIVAHRIGGTEVATLLGDKVLALMTETGLTTPWLKAYATTADGIINRVAIQAAASGAGPRIDTESYGSPPDANVSLTLDTAGTGFHRIFTNNAEKLRVESTGPRTLSGVATTFSTNRAGRATLVAGTITVTVAGATATTEAYITRRTPGGTIGDLSYSINTGAQTLTITSASATDTSLVSWALIGTNAATGFE